MIDGCHRQSECKDLRQKLPVVILKFVDLTADTLLILIPVLLSSYTSFLFDVYLSSILSRIRDKYKVTVGASFITLQCVKEHQNLFDPFHL